MAKFYGEIGFVEMSETSPGVYEEVVVERKYYGDIIRNNRRLETGDKMNDGINVSNQISIVMDAYAEENFFAMRYLRWMGAAWKITDVDVERPRLTITLGGLYNGAANQTSSST